MTGFRVFVTVATLVASMFTPGRAHALEDPVVYVRCPRTDTSIVLDTGVTMTGLDIYDVLPDVTHFYGGFSGPCDLVLRQPDGAEEILYDCGATSTEAQACAAMDPAVSFDGETIAFTVFRGALEPLQRNFSETVGGDGAYYDLPSRVLRTTDAQLHLVSVATGEVTPMPSLPETFDTGPTWLPNGRLAFTSSRDGNRSTLVFGTNTTSLGSRIWTVDLDGKNLDLASHHSLAMEQHPLVLQDGRVAYSSWQIFGGRPFSSTNGSPGGFGTINNAFHIFTQYPDGAEQFAFFGQHAGFKFPLTGAGVTHLAAHFLGQSSDGRVWFSDYYRGNNNAFGNVIGVMPEPEGQEGMFDPAAPRADMYAPNDAISLATWSTSRDSFAGLTAAPEYNDPEYDDPLLFAGKVGHPSGLPNNKLLLTWGKGACSTVANDGVFEAQGLPTPSGTSGSGGGVAANVFTQLGMDMPACDAGIYATTVIPSTHPSDLERVVDTRQWHEIMARAVVPYADIHGMERPELRPRADLATSHALLPPGTPFGLLGAASMLDRETHPRSGIHFVGEIQFQLQGTDTINYADPDLCGVRILGVLPNRGDDTFDELNNVAGERVVILGEVAVRNYDDGGVALLDDSGYPDTSFLLRMPANVPYLMQGIDCLGRTLNTDQTWQSLRPGEMKTCGGCHVHSKESRVDFESTAAALANYNVTRLGEGSVPLLVGPGDPNAQVETVDGYALQIDFEQDIFPIFEARCNACHAGASPAANLDLSLPGTEDGSTWDCLVADRSQNCIPEPQRMITTHGTTFRRPQLTRYIRSFNALGSLLYWKAAGERTDANTDATFDDESEPEDRDLDFGAPHPTDATPQELGLLARWIDLGSAGGPGESIDTQRPTLTVAAVVDGESVTALRVGTVDIPSGVDIGSLVVCVLGAGGACGPNLATTGAEPHGTLELVLDAALEDPDAEIEARVADLAGNETVVRVTVARLLDSPPPTVPGGTDSGGADDTGSGGEGAGPGADAGSDPGTGGTTTDTGGATDGGGGCGCTARPGGGSPRGSLGWLLALFGLVLRERRRTP